MISDETRALLAHRYGHAARDVLALAAEDERLAQPISPDLPDLMAEVVIAVRKEQALTVADVLHAPHAPGPARRAAPVRARRGRAAPGRRGDGRRARLGRRAAWTRRSPRGTRRRRPRGSRPRWSRPPA